MAEPSSPVPGSDTWNHVGDLVLRVLIGAFVGAALAYFLKGWEWVEFWTIMGAFGGIAGGVLLHLFASLKTKKR